MSEVSRLNTLSADRAKGDFISNVSHELRSPLHGILASVEFLADSKLDAFQSNLVDTIDICGRTLLDTIEHVLDFSKIKRFGQESSQSMGVVADLDVSAVIEEVLEGVYSGFEFNGLSSEGLADRTRSGARNPPTKASIISPDELPRSSDDPVVVIIDIDYKDQWKFPAAPGTLKRLTMNVFGNALKYTHSGYIKVKLEAKPIPASISTKDGREKTMVTLTITDSGQGMSSDFMKTKLFMPFSQEDNTAPGTGLGMSIVKQIVDLSGGRIDVRSDQQSGTEIKLSLPLDNCLPDSETTPINTRTPRINEEDPIEAVRRRAHGRTIHIQGFGIVPGSSKVQSGALAGLKESMEKFSTQWLRLNLVSSNEDADIAISDETAYLNSSSKLRGQKILLVLCDNKARRRLYPTRADNGQIVEFVSKPCGPHRLAKSLLNCLDTEDARPRATQRERSSIGFSPARYPGSQTTSETDTSRPSLSSRTTSDNSQNGISFESSTISTPSVLPSSMESLDSTFPENTTSLAKTDLQERQPKMLLVEDNPINMMLLATYMKKNKWEFEEASNGLLALQAFRESAQGFDVIFMDVSMPVMTGYESTRHIRTVEAERRLAYEHQNLIQSPAVPMNITSFPFTTQPDYPMSANSPSAFSPALLDYHLSAPRLQLNEPALIIALTGFSSEKDQESAFEAGVDIFMTKPVRFREVGKILEGWMKSRDERMEVGVGV